MSATLRIEDLRVGRRGGHGPDLLRGVDLELRSGETLALVGESGSGKSLTGLALLGLLDEGLELRGGRIGLAGRDLASLAPRARRALLGRELAAIFQDPGAALNPHHRVGPALVEILRHRGGLDRRAARQKALRLLADCGLDEVERIAASHPHRLSGGQKQRAMIAMAIALDPDFLVADEATTALDVATQARVVELLDRLRRERGLGLLFISHDLGVVQRLADRVALMYAGRVVESAPAALFFAGPRHPYGRALLAARPTLFGPFERRAPIAGSAPGPEEIGAGCAFAPRCPLARATCHEVDPPARALADGRTLACPVAEEGG
ncbi:MAG: ABC transporter ATP-binding protein [Planctomycetes bacterium]|nr:ABC transporter ATP-binding protein [Planctomycetota bacterium]